MGPMPEPLDMNDRQAIVDSLRAYSDRLDACVRAAGAK